MDTLPVQFTDWRESVHRRLLGGTLYAQVVEAIAADHGKRRTGEVLQEVRPWLEQQYAGLELPLSKSVPMSAPVLYEVYRPSVLTMEAKVYEAIVLYLVELARIKVLEQRMKTAKDGPAVRRSTDATLLPAEYSNLRELGQKADRGRITTKKAAAEEPFRIPLDIKRTTDALRAAMVADAYEVMEMSVPKGVVTISDVVIARTDAYYGAQREINRLLYVEFPRVVHALLDQSQREALDVVPPYESSLRDLLADMSSSYLALVQSSDTLDDLQRGYVVLMEERLEQVGSIFESYRHDAPLFSPIDNIPGAPTQRDYSVLYQTPPGLRLIQMYEASRRVLPPKVTKELKFLGEIPRNLVDTDLAPLAPAASPHPMDRVQRYFDSQSITGDLLGDSYRQLKARTAAVAAAAAAAAAPVRRGRA